MRRALLFLALPLALAACASPEQQLYDEAIDILMAEADAPSRSESELNAAVDTLLNEAADQGHSQACLLLVTLERTRARVDMGALSAMAEAELIEEIEACPTASQDGTRSALEHHPVRNLIERGTPEAQTRLDSLRTLGVFERHPHLDPATLS